MSSVVIFSNLQHWKPYGSNIKPLTTMDKKIIFIFVGLLLCFRLDFATGFFFNIFARNRNGAVPSYRRPVSRWSSWSAWSAPATNSCSDCWCQCSAFTFIDSYGRTQGNCRRYQTYLIIHFSTICGQY